MSGIEDILEGFDDAVRLFKKRKLDQEIENQPKDGNKSTTSELLRIEKERLDERSKALTIREERCNKMEKELEAKQILLGNEMESLHKQQKELKDKKISNLDYKEGGKDFCTHPRCIAERDALLIKELELKKTEKDLYLSQKIFKQSLNAFMNMKSQFEKKNNGKYKEDGTFVIDGSSSPKNKTTETEDLERLLETMKCEIGRFDHLEPGELPKWKQQLDNKIFLTKGGHAFPYSRTEISWGSLRSLISRDNLTDEAVDFICKMCIFVPPKHKLYNLADNGNNPTYVMEPFLIEWIMCTSRKEFNEFYKYVCDYNGVRNWKNVENMLEEREWSVAQRQCITFLYQSIRQFQNGNTSQRDEEDKESVSRPRWFSQNSTLFPCVGRGHWSVLYVSGASDTINHIYEWVRMSETEQNGYKGKKPMLNTYHLDSAGNTVHKNSRPNLSDMISLYAFFTVNFENAGNAALKADSDRYESSYHRGLFTRRSKTFALASIRQQFMDCGLYCAYNTNILMLIADDLEKCSYKKNCQKTYNNAVQKLLPYKDFDTVVEKTAHYLFRNALLLANYGLQSTNLIQIPTFSDVNKVEVEKNIYQKWANFEALVEKNYKEKKNKS